MLRALPLLCSALLLFAAPTGLACRVADANADDRQAEAGRGGRRRRRSSAPTGLMNRFSLQPDHGMLFVFERPQPLAFWMKNTYIPLSIAFVDANGAILNIEDMKPHDESTHWSKGNALYAIEMKQGWFAAKGIDAGAKVGVWRGLVGQ